MDFSAIFARFVALIGSVALLWRRLQGSTPAPAWGNAPAIPEAKPQGAIPTLKMPTAQGWSDGQKPIVATGLKVNAFATDLDHPRWIYVMPNGDVLIAESTQIAGPPRSVFREQHAAFSARGIWSPLAAHLDAALSAAGIAPDVAPLTLEEILSWLDPATAPPDRIAVARR